MLLLLIVKTGKLHPDIIQTSENFYIRFRIKTRDKRTNSQTVKRANRRRVFHRIFTSWVQYRILGSVPLRLFTPRQNDVSVFRSKFIEPYGGDLNYRQ